MPTVDAIARLKITLEHVKPDVVRRIEVPLGLRLDRLHLVIQASFNWTNSHLWEFRAGGAAWGPSDPDMAFNDGSNDAAKATLLDVLEDTGAKTIKYVYDFGDHWSHSIRVERIGAPDPRLTYPGLLEAKGRRPPEDVGGPPGYADFLQALADPRHERHADLREWYGDDDFDPTAIDVAAIADALEALAASWTRKRTVNKPKR